MYDYRFAFYKPGKDYFSGNEFVDTLNKLHGLGYEIKFRPNDPHVNRKKGTVHFNPNERNLNVEVIKEGRFMDLTVGPAEGKHGLIALLAIAEEQLDDQFKNEQGLNGQILSEAAMAVSNALKPLFAWGDHELELDNLEPFLNFDRIGAIAWSNFFSQELIERLGGLDKILLRPQDKQYREGAQGMLKEFGFVPITLSESPTKDLETMVALECERRYPGAILKSFKVPPLSAIEVEP